METRQQEPQVVMLGQPPKRARPMKARTWVLCTLLVMFTGPFGVVYTMHRGRQHSAWKTLHL